jgi:hypothetical protein
MLMTKASNHVNLISMVLGWPCVSLVVDFCRDPNLGFTTKAKACKGAGKI